MSATSNYAYGPSAPLPRRRSGMRTAGKWMFFVGLVLSLLTVGVLVWGGNQAFRAFSALEGDTIPVDGRTSVSMPEGGVRFILSEGAPAPSCTVTDPEGATVPTAADDAVADLASDAQYSIVGTIAASEPGDYTVECTGGTASVSGLLPTSALLGATAAALALVALVPLGLLTLLGLILWLVGRSRDRRAAMDAGPGGGTTSGYGYQPPPPAGHGQRAPEDPTSPSAGQGQADPWAPPPPPGRRPDDPGHGPGR